MKGMLLKAALVMLAVIMIVGISMIPATAASDSYTVTVSDETAGTATVTDGEEFTIHITVTGDSFNGLQGTLLYDDTLFELKSITGPAAADDPKTKKVELYTLSGTAYADGTEVATVVFKAKATGTGTFSVDPITVGDYEDFRKGDAVPASAVNDKVTVKSGGGGGGGGGSQTGGNESIGSDIVVVPQDSSFRGSTDGEYLSDGSIKITVRDESGNILETVPGGVSVMIPDVQDGQVVVMVDEKGKIIDLVEKSLVENHTAYALLQGTATIRIVNNPKSFVDVKDSDWFAGAVAFTSSHELFRGVSDNEFAPQLPMTRAMLVTVLYRLENEPETAGTISFDDVMEGTWYTDAVAWAAENGIVLGTGDGFEPNENVTREQIATMLYRYMQFLGVDTSARGDVSKFSDGSEVSPWAVDAMAWAVGIGLFQGDDTGSLNPGDDVTRAEVATLMERLMTMIVKPQ